MKYKKSIKLSVIIPTDEKSQVPPVEIPKPEPKDISNNNVTWDVLPPMDKQKELIEFLRKKYHVK